MPLTIDIDAFLKAVSGDNSNYRYVIEAIDTLQHTQIKWMQGQHLVSASVISAYKHIPRSGTINIWVFSELARRLLDINQGQNFSFLKDRIFRLKTRAGLKLYPFFKTWANHGKYVCGLEELKKIIGLEASAYPFFSAFQDRILLPAISEINQRTDLFITYERIGQGLNTARPRVRSLQFTIMQQQSHDLPFL